MVREKLPTLFRARTSGSPARCQHERGGRSGVAVLRTFDAGCCADKVRLRQYVLHTPREDQAGARAMPAGGRLC
jgi:hypothetical protein